MNNPNPLEHTVEMRVIDFKNLIRNNLIRLKKIYVNNEDLQIMSGNTPLADDGILTPDMLSDIHLIIQ